MNEMTREEAQCAVEEIRDGLGRVSERLLELYERRGWEVLGYASWRACVIAEFNFSQSRAYQLLKAALIGRELSTNVENLNEAQARELSRLDDPKERRAAWLEVAESGEPTAARVREVVGRRLSGDYDEAAREYPVLARAASRGDATAIYHRLQRMGEVERRRALKGLERGDFAVYAALTDRPLVVALEPGRDAPPALRWTAAVEQGRRLAEGVEVVGGVALLLDGWPEREAGKFCAEVGRLAEVFARWVEELRLRKVA